MWFGFEFAIGAMLAIVVVPLAVWLIILGVRLMRRGYNRALQTFVGKALAIVFVFALCIAWIFTH